MLAQSCSSENAQVKKAKDTLKTAENKLKQCKNKPKKPTPEQEYNRLWSAAVKKYQKQIRDIQTKQYEEHQAIMKKTGWNPEKQSKKKK